MSTAVITTQAGGAFRLTDAFLVTLDHVIGRKADGDQIRYDVQEGDNVRFVSETTTAQAYSLTRSIAGDAVIERDGAEVGRVIGTMSQQPGRAYLASMSNGLVVAYNSSRNNGELFAAIIRADKIYRGESVESLGKAVSL